MDEENLSPAHTSIANGKNTARAVIPSTAEYHAPLSAMERKDIRLLGEHSFLQARRATTGIKKENQKNSIFLKKGIDKCLAMWYNNNVLERAGQNEQI